MANNKKFTGVMVEVGGESLMVTREELEGGKNTLKAVESGLAVPRHIAENVKSSVVAMKFYWPSTEGGPNEFQGALLYTPEAERFFLLPEPFLKARERYKRFSATGEVNG